MSTLPVPPTSVDPPSSFVEDLYDLVPEAVHIELWSPVPAEVDSVGVFPVLGLWRR